MPERRVPADRSRPVRTFNARRGRLSPAARVELEARGPELGLPDGPLDPGSAFGRVAPLVLEVGSGFGHAARAYAQAHPGHDVVAVDVHTRGVAHLVAAVARSGPANLRVVEGDAVELLAGRLAPSTLTAVHLFFPDPWPKRSHHRRRFVRRDVIDLVVDRLSPGGSLLVATDDAAYAAQAQDVLGSHPSLHGGRGERPPWRPTAGYEAKALAAGRSVVDLCYRRTAGVGGT